MSIFERWNLDRDILVSELMVKTLAQEYNTLGNSLEIG
jgi:hypothetical protein